MPLHEAMACGIPSIVPDYSALSDWPTLQKTVDSVAYVPVTKDPVLNNNGINTIHRMIDIDAAIETLESLYQDNQRRLDLGAAGLKVATDKRYMWKNISKQFFDLFEQSTKVTAFAPLPTTVRQDVQVWRKGK